MSTLEEKKTKLNKLKCEYDYVFDKWVEKKKSLDYLESSMKYTQYYGRSHELKKDYKKLKPIERFLYEWKEKLEQQVDKLKEELRDEE